MPFYSNLFRGPRDVFAISQQKVRYFCARWGQASEADPFFPMGKMDKCYYRDDTTVQDH